MKILELRRGNDTEMEFSFAEIILENDENVLSAICIEANELRLLVCSENGLAVLSEELELTEDGLVFEVETVNAEGESLSENHQINIEELLAYFMNSDLEKYECWRNDCGEEGLSEAAESNFAVPLLLAYSYIRGASADDIFAQLEESDADTFFENYDITW